MKNYEIYAKVSKKAFDSFVKKYPRKAIDSVKSLKELRSGYAIEILRLKTLVASKCNKINNLEKRMKGMINLPKATEEAYNLRKTIQDLKLTISQQVETISHWKNKAYAEPTTSAIVGQDTLNLGSKWTTVAEAKDFKSLTDYLNDRGLVHEHENLAACVLRLLNKYLEDRPAADDYYIVIGSNQIRIEDLKKAMQAIKEISL